MIVPILHRPLYYYLVTLSLGTVAFCGDCIAGAESVVYYPHDSIDLLIDRSIRQHHHHHYWCVLFPFVFIVDESLIEGRKARMPRRMILVFWIVMLIFL
jgi:hypothetical protein